MHSRSPGGAPAVADPLSEVLRDLRPSGVAYGRCELTRPWGLDLPPDGAARFHVVTEGDAWLHAEAPAAVGPPAGVRLQAGDVVLLPHGTGHTLADAPRRGPRPRATRPIDTLPREPLGDRVYALHAGGGGRRTRLFCGSVTFDEPALHPLLALMPHVVHVCGASAADPALPALLHTMADEVATPRLGGATVLARLAEVVITRVIRAWAEAPCSDTTGWLAAIRDPQVGRALAAIHRDPGAPWTVTSLAGVAQASRSVFAERFTAVVGVPPGRYVARWRMHVAGGWLRRERLTVGEAAARLGYDSEPAFSRAFKRAVGVPPSAVRRDGSRVITR